MDNIHFLRIDGRRSDQLRPITFTPDYTQYAEGSVLITWGETIVLCNLTIQEGVPGWMAGQRTGWLTAEYALLPRSTHTRTPREIHGLKGRTQEIRRLIGRALRMAVDLTLLGERTLLLDCDVIQADGGTRVASITGGYVALALGLHKLITKGAIPAETLHPPIAAVSVGMVNHQPLLDLNYQEDSQADVDMNIVKTSQGGYIELQGTAENQPFSPESLNQMLNLADQGISQILSLQNMVLQTLL
jgi:ribonuclease PH